MEGPLSGVRVTELSQMLACPGAGMFLADYGAQVVKIEPLVGDQTRRIGSKGFLVLNRNKKGMALDVGVPQGKEVLLRLLDQSDVFLHNLKVGSAERLGIGYEEASRQNPRLIYAHLTAFGSEGPYARRAGYDRIIQGLTGVMAANAGPDGEPRNCPVWPADSAAPMLLAFAIVCALWARERTGKGTKLETSLLNAAIAMQAVQLVYPESDAPPSRSELQPGYLTFRTRDGAYLNVVALNEKEWRNLCTVLEVPHLATDERFNSVPNRHENASALYPILEELFRWKSADEWLHLLHAHDVPCGPIVGRRQVFNDPQVLSNQMMERIEYPEIGPVRMMGRPIRYGDFNPGPIRRAPSLGEHTDEVLASLGYSPQDIRRLRARNVVK